MNRLDNLEKELLILEDEIKTEKIALDILKAATLLPEHTERLKVMSDKLWEFLYAQEKEYERLIHIEGAIRREVYSLKYL